MAYQEKHEGAYHTAEEFILAAMEIAKNVENNRFIAPIMVCFSFAIELFLKAILVEKQINPGKNHNLQHLFTLLPDERKEWVHRMYEQLAGAIQREEFESEIERWSNAFTSIRYWHDVTGKEQAYFDCSNFIPNLAICLNNAYLHTEHFPRFRFPQIVETKSYSG